MMKIIAILIIIVIGHSAQGQNILTGMVADSATFTPMPYVTVAIKNKNKGTITDDGGNFKIVVYSDDTLVFQFVGYNTLEIAAQGLEANLILLSEKITMLNTVIIQDTRDDISYEEIYSDEILQWKKNTKRLPFYYSKGKKQIIKVNRLTNENIRVKTYVDVIIKNDENRLKLMKLYNLSETEYYDLLAGFNSKYYTIMYYLTAGELITLLNNYFLKEKNKGQ
jgi:hypothetical protein